MPYFASAFLFEGGHLHDVTVPKTDGVKASNFES